MLGAGLQFNRSRNGEDRFYSAARARLNQDSLRRAKSDVTSSRSRPNPDQTAPEVSSTLPASEPSSACNLERFLESVTPSAPAQYLSKTQMTTVRDWRRRNSELQPYFMLSNLWESFKEWSAYGVGVPLILNDRDSVVQYYVPYLSGIQLYTDPTKKPSPESRRLDEDSDGEYRDTSSDGSSDAELEKRRDHHHQHMGFQEGFTSDEGEPGGSSQGRLLFGYFEQDLPHCREPLANKVSDLAQRFPELTTLKSCDLVSPSWISVSWYPIYRIPTGPTLRDLDACFLTFHSLHTPTTEGEATDHPPKVTYPTESSGIPHISLPVFGLASYKYKPSLWTPTAGRQKDLANSLLQAADNWLSSLKVYHPDFSFFCRR